MRGARHDEHGKDLALSRPRTRPTEAQARAYDLEAPPDDDNGEPHREDTQAAPDQGVDGPGFIKPDAGA